MRQSKVSELIHSSEAYPNLDFAKVAVHFQNVIDQPDGSFTVVPGSEFVVTREARRDNSSRYWINDKSSNFSEVTKFLKTRGIDLDHNRPSAAPSDPHQHRRSRPRPPALGPRTRRKKTPPHPLRAPPPGAGTPPPPLATSAVTTHGASACKEAAWRLVTAR